MGNVSIVTPTYQRPDEVMAMFENLCQLDPPPLELILVDGAPPAEGATEEIVRKHSAMLPFPCVYLRHGGGTAIQRNVGIELAKGDFVAFVDDDIRLVPGYFQAIADAFALDTKGEVGGIAGYISNQFLNPETSRRWRWYRRLRLFSIWEPGRFDYKTGYPINRYLQPPHQGIREIDFMGSNCAVWRREVLDSGLRFDKFFVDYGMLEDTHFALRARHRWKLWECGKASCLHLHSPRGRIKSRPHARKTATNYRYVFVDIVRHRSLRQEFRFWLVQGFDLVRFIAKAIRTREKDDWLYVLGKMEGIIAATRIKAVAASSP